MSKQDEPEAKSPSLRERVWTPLRTSNVLEEAWFQAETDADKNLVSRWVAAKTVADGNCGVDAVAIALRLPRDKTTYGLLRRQIADNILKEEGWEFQTTNRKVTAEAAKILKDGAWVADDDIVRLLCNDTYAVIPIILNGQYNPNAVAKFDALPPKAQDAMIARARKAKIVLPHQHAMFLGFLQSVAAIRKRRAEDKDFAAYIVLKHVGASHWICLGQQVADEDKVRAIFIESELPPGLLTTFLAQTEIFG